MNNKLTDERPDDEDLEFLITIRREIAERHASEGRMAQSAVHTLILNALLELQERRKVDSEPVAPKTLPCSVELNPGLIIGRGCKTETLLTALKRRADYYAELESMTPEQRAEHDAGIAEFKAMLGHSVITDTPPVPVVPEECAAMLQGSQPVSNRDELREHVRREHAEWSDKTFDQTETALWRLESGGVAWMGIDPAKGGAALPAQSSDEVNAAAWKLHNMLREYGPLNGRQLNNLKGCFYEALKVAMHNLEHKGD